MLPGSTVARPVAGRKSPPYQRPASVNGRSHTRASGSLPRRSPLPGSEQAGPRAPSSTPRIPPIEQARPRLLGHLRARRAMAIDALCEPLRVQQRVAAEAEVAQQRKVRVDERNKRNLGPGLPPSSAIAVFDERDLLREPTTSLVLVVATTVAVRLVLARIPTATLADAATLFLRLFPSFFGSACGFFGASRGLFCSACCLVFVCQRSSSARSRGQVGTPELLPQECLSRLAAP